MGNMSAQLEAAGLWVSLLLGLFTFSALVRDNYFSRLAQHIFVGAALGYLAVLLLQNVLRPRLIVPLVQSGGSDFWAATPAILGILLLMAGIDRTISQGRAAESPSPFGRRLLYGLGMCAVAILLGVGISTAVLGAIQGTLAPQFRQVASSTLPPNATGSQIGATVLMLLITTGVLIHLYGEPALAERDAEQVGQPLVKSAVALWSWLGKRVLWLGAGVLFARLVISRISFLGAQIDSLRHLLEQTPLWRIMTGLGQIIGF